MRKLLAILVILGLLIGGGLWLAPSFLPMAKQAEEWKLALQAQGLRLEYDGSPKASLTDGGSISLQNVRIYAANAVAGNPPLVKAPTVKAMLDAATLFSEKPTIAALEMQDPVFQLDAMPLVTGQPAQAAWMPLLALPLKIANGTVEWQQASTTPARWEALNGWVALRNNALEGDIIYRFQQSDWSLKGSWRGARAEAGTAAPLDVSLSDGHSTLQVHGTLAHAEQGWQAEGNLLLETKQPWQSLRLFYPSLTEEIAATLQPFPLKLEGAFQWHPAEGLRLSNSELQTETARMVVSGQWQTAAEVPSLHVTLEAETWDMDAVWTNLKPLIEWLRQEHTRSLAALRLPGWDSGRQQVPFLPEAMQVNISSRMKTMQWMGQNWQDAAWVLQHVNGVWVVQQASAAMPGAERLVTNGRLTESGQGWRYRGRVEGKGTSLRSVLTALQIALPPLPEDRLQTFDGAMTLDMDSSLIQLTEMDLQLDETRLLGAVVYHPPGGTDNAATTPLLRASLRLDQLDVDRYALPTSLLEAEKQRALDRESLTRQTPEWLAHFPLRLTMAMAVDRLQWRAIEWGNLQARAEAEPGLLHIQSAEGLLEGKPFQLQARLQAKPRRPHLNLTLQAEALAASDMAAFLHGQTISLPAVDWRAGAVADAAWSNNPFDVTLWQLVDGQVQISVVAVALAQEVVQNLQCDTKGQQGQWDFQSCGWVWQEGQWGWTGQLQTGELPQIKGQMTVSGLKIEGALADVMDVQNLRGKLAWNAVLETNGTSVLQWLQHLQLNSNFRLTPLVIEGVEIGPLAQKIPYVRTTADVANLSRVALTGGRTEIEALQGIAYVKDGVLQVPQSEMQTLATRGTLQCAVDIPRLVMQTALSFRPRSMVADSMPPLTMRWQGAVETPERQLDVRELENYVANKTVERSFR